MRTAMASALAKVLRGGRSGASLLHAAGGGRMPQEGAAAPALPRGGGATVVPPPATATRGTGGCEASSHSQSLLQAAGRRTPQEGGLALASLLPRLGARATVPPPAAAFAAAGMGSRRASSLSRLHAAGRRMPHKDGLASLLPRLDASAPCAMPWQFHQIAGLRSSAAAGEQIPGALSKEHITTVKNLYEKVESLEANIKFVDNMLWVLGVLVLVAAATLPKGVRNLWTTNSEEAIERQAAKDIAEKLKQVSSLLLDMSHELKEDAAAKRMAPMPVLPAATPAPLTKTSDH